MRILLLTPSMPWPPMWGFNIRVLNLLRQLGRTNEVSLLCYAGPGDADGRKQIGEFCDRIFTAPDVERSMLRRRLVQARAAVGTRSFHLARFLSPSLQAELSRVLDGGEYDLVQVESSALAGFDFGTTPVVLDEHNLEFELLRRSNEVERSPVRRLFAALECRKVEREETEIWKRVDGCALTSEREQVLVNRVTPGTPTAVVPNAVDLDHFRPSAKPSAKDTIVFTGLMTYRPNADGVSHFVRSIFPLVRAARPDARFTAVGWGLPGDVRPLLGGAVFHTGRVEDVRPYLATAAVVVVPLRIGSGTRLKVLEALAMGKAVVSTSIGCEGLEVRNGEHLLIADDPAEFARCVVRLLEDPLEATRVGRHGRALVERRYGWGQSVERLEQLHQRLLDPGAFAAPAAVSNAR